MSSPPSILWDILSQQNPVWKASQPDNASLVSAQNAKLQYLAQMAHNSTEQQSNAIQGQNFQANQKLRGQELQNTMQDQSTKNALESRRTEGMLQNYQAQQGIDQQKLGLESRRTQSELEKNAAQVEESKSGVFEHMTNAYKTQHQMYLQQGYADAFKKGGIKAGDAFMAANEPLKYTELMKTRAELENSQMELIKNRTSNEKEQLELLDVQQKAIMPMAQNTLLAMKESPTKGMTFYKGIYPAFTAVQPGAPDPDDPNTTPQMVSDYLYNQIGSSMSIMQKGKDGGMQPNPVAYQLGMPGTDSGGPPIIGGQQPQGQMSTPQQAPVQQQPVYYNSNPNLPKINPYALQQKAAVYYGTSLKDEVLSSRDNKLATTSKGLLKNLAELDLALGDPDEGFEAYKLPYDKDLGNLWSGNFTPGGSLDLPESKFAKFIATSLPSSLTKHPYIQKVNMNLSEAKGAGNVIESNDDKGDDKSFFGFKINNTPTPDVNSTPELVKDWLDQKRESTNYSLTKGGNPQDTMLPLEKLLDPSTGKTMDRQTAIRKIKATALKQKMTQVEVWKYLSDLTIIHSDKFKK